MATDHFHGYDDPSKVQMYRRATAGRGIEYLLPSVYGPIFMDAARAAGRAAGADRLRILEFGCGAGMALHYVAETLGADRVDTAVGTDFVPEMIEAAEADLQQYGPAWAAQRIHYAVARNEELLPAVAGVVDADPPAATGTFHLALGVNTFRYAIRNATAATVVDQVGDLLAPGGRVVVIDMNDRFPYGLKPKADRDGAGRARVRFGTEPLPTLDEYARPWEEGGFKVVDRKHFCWVPHSAAGLRFRLSHAAAPVLQRLAPDHAMRSLVVAQKP